jgi:hypothetical protein
MSRSADLLVKELLTNEQKIEELKDNPGKVLVETASAVKKKAEPFEETLNYRLIVIFLGSLGVITALGVTGLALYRRSTPSGLLALGSVAVGALAGILAPSPQVRLPLD